ncbi:MAG: hypothetical protein FH748_04970 [Balneolaceae bacterium]|nr:hypothetical protein [Balneolaceae bacterium]
MKRGILISLLLLSVCVYAQTPNFEDDFSDQDISNWTGNLSEFSFVKEGNNTLLQLNAATSGSSFLSIPSSSITGYWEFFVRLNFSPSNNNNAQFYLMSDAPDLNGTINGYMLQAGENLSGDVFRLFKITNGNKDGEVLAGTTNISSGGDFRVRLSRSSTGEWTLEVAEGYTGTLQEEASAFNNDYTSASHFGFIANYTSSNTDNMAFDFKIDVPPLQIDSLLVINKQTLDLAFNRDINFSSVQSTDFSLIPGSRQPTDLVSLSDDTLRIEFSSRISSGPNTLEISGISDEAEESNLADTSLSFVIYDSYSAGDVIINEFMKDPPEGAEEYIEVKNISSRYLNLMKWSMGDNKSLNTVSDWDLLLEPGTLLVFTSDTAALTQYFGTGPYHQTSLPSLNNSGDQLRLYTPDDLLVDSLEYDASWGGDNTSLERRSASAPSVFVENWQDSTTENGGTPGLPNNITPDLNPPVLNDIMVEDSQHLVIVFSERIEGASAQDISNYTVEEANNSSSVIPVGHIHQFSKDSVRLSLSSALDETIYEIEVRQLSDIFGNTLQSQTHPFQYIKLTEADFGDIAINEFMYDPPESFSEFIELYNHTDQNISLRNWTINDNTGTDRLLTDQDIILEKNSYLVLLPDSTMIENGTDFPFLISSLPSLNNGGDAVVLKNESGQIIDSLSYTSQWGGDEVSLERRSPEVLATYPENWDNHPTEILASPGIENKIEPDTKAPKIISVNPTNSTSVQLQFSEHVKAKQAENIANYSLSPSIQINDATLSGQMVTLSLASPLTSQIFYTLKVENQEDIFGNPLISSSIEFRYLVFTDATAGDVVFNEILYKRQDETTAEFVELYNPTDKNIDLSHWTFTDASSASAQIPEGQQLAAGEYLALTDRPSLTSTNVLYFSTFPSLNNRGDALVLKNAEDQLIDSLFYRDSWGGDIAGSSLERKDPQAASNDASNWKSNDNGHHSAGNANSVFEEDTTPPEMIFANNIPEGIQVVFSEFIHLDSNTSFSLSGQTASVLSFDSTRANILILAKTGSAIQELQVSGLKDFRGNTSANLIIPIAQPLSSGKLVINEILFTPLADAHDNLPDQSEYIELYNRSEAAISLEGLYLHDQPDEDQNVRAIYPVSTIHRWMPAESYMLLYAEDQTSVFTESQTARYFELSGLDEKFTLQIDRSSLSLGSSGDAIYIADSTGTIIDSVFYDEEWQNPNLYTTKGIALERINPQAISNEPSNWSSSTDVRGGTPGEQNSIFQQPGDGPDDQGITFTPNPFSPDDDGFEDHLFINYKLDEADYLLRVRIFDRYGRQVRKLADSKAAGYEGTLLWDGLTDDHARNRVGIYIVLFEAFNNATGSKKIFKETVVLARKF